MAYSRQWVADTLRHLGFTQQAEEAMRVLPEEMDLEQLRQFGDRYGIDAGMLTERMGGSPLYTQVLGQPWSGHAARGPRYVSRLS